MKLKRRGKIILFFIFLIMTVIFKIYITENGLKFGKQYKIVKKLSNSPEKTSQAVNEKIIIKKENKFGIIDIEGNEIKPMVYDYILRIEGNLYFLQQGENKILCNINSGKEIPVTEVTIIKSGLYRVMYNDKYGVTDENLNIIIETENDFIDGNQDNILVFKGKSITLYDTDMEKTEIQEKYEKVKIGIGEYLFVRKNGDWGIIDRYGNLKTKLQYDDFLNLNDYDVLIGYVGEKSYLINLRYEDVLEKELDYENYGMESADRIMILKDGKIGYIDIFGEEVIPPIYDGGFIFYEGKDFIQVKNGKGWELLDKNGMKYKEIHVDDLGEYKDGYMLVENKGKYGYADKNGDIKIPIEYDFANDFANGVAVVAGDYGYGVIDKENGQVLPLKYDDIQVIGNYIYVREDNKYGLYSLDGNEILRLEYDYLNGISEKMLFFRKGNESGFIQLD